MFHSLRWFIRSNRSDGSPPGDFPILVTSPSTVLVGHPQTVEADVLRVVVIGEGKCVVTEPAAMAAARLCQTESTALVSYLFRPGFHIIYVFVEVNENPGRIMQLFRTGLIASHFLEQPGEREIPIIIKSGQRNSKNLRCLLIGHANEISQFNQFGLNGSRKRFHSCYGFWELLSVLDVG
jgi:hypothetical protein